MPSMPRKSSAEVAGGPILKRPLGRRAKWACELLTFGKRYQCSTDAWEFLPRVQGCGSGHLQPHGGLPLTKKEYTAEYSTGARAPTFAAVHVDASGAKPPMVSRRWM